MHLIEPAKTGRSKCQICRGSIDQGELRLAEQFVSVYSEKPSYRFHHLGCAADHRPRILESALSAYTEALPERETLMRRINTAIERERAAQVGEAAVPTPEPTSRDEAALLDRLVEDPDDEGTILVYADLLQSRGEPRGELIMLQHQLGQTRDPARADGAREPGQPRLDKTSTQNDTVRIEGLLRRQTELLDTPELLPYLSQHDHVEWKNGFVRRLELCGQTGSKLPERPDLLAHPSLRLLAELRITFFLALDGVASVESLVDSPPATVKRLWLGDHVDHRLGPVERLVEGLPRLERLSLCGSADLDRLSHEGLTHLSFPSLGWNVEWVTESLVKLNPEQLPGLRGMQIEGSNRVCRVLGQRGWLEQLTDLDLSKGTVDDDGVQALASHLPRGRRLRRLDVQENLLSQACRRLLEPLCDELIFGQQTKDEPDDVWYVLHERKPEWGRGEVLLEFEGKLEVRFEHAGLKVFRADLPFLRSV